jgi:S-phase kinase-associated protein 1
MASAAKSDKSVVGSEEKEISPEGDITLISKERTSFTLPKKCAFMSNLVKITSEQDRSETHINVKIDSHSLANIVSYLNHHDGVKPKEIKKPLRSLDMSKIVDDAWDAKFINSFPQEELKEIITAANYMDIQPLLQLACAKVASLIKGKTNEEIKKLFEEGKVGFVPNSDSSSSSSSSSSFVPAAGAPVAGSPMMTSP